LGAVLVLASLGLLWLLTAQPISVFSFFMALGALTGGALVVALGYWTLGFYTLRYRVDRNGIVITWGAIRQVIPTANIERLAPGVELAPGTRLRGFMWPGYYIGSGHDSEKGPVLCYATRPRAEQLLVVTPTLTYAISPRDPAAFELEYELRSRLGPTVALTQGTSLARIARLPLWRDRWLWVLLGLMALANVLLFGYVFWQYPYLPELLPLHFGIQGQVDRIGERNELFLLPIIGLVVSVVNVLFGSLIHVRERLGTYMLWASALAVQILLWLATANIILRALRTPTF
jgi:hypothetical protein